MILAKNKKSLDDILNKYPTNKPYAFDGKPISTKSETKREQNKSSAPSLDDILNKYPTKPKYTFDGKSPAATGGTKKKYTDFNSETQNAYKSAKDKVTSKTTIKSNLSDTERKKRIGEIETEIRNLNTQLHGIGRAGAYGSTESLKPLKEKTEKRIAELSKELKSLERVGTFSASELKQFEIDDAKAKVSSARQKVNSYGARPTLDSAESFKQANSDLFKAREELENLERQKALYDDIADFGYVSHDDTFTGQWRANYRSNELSREADKAMSEYIANPTEENKQIAYAYDAFEKAYKKNNEKALDDENVKASWLTKSMAGYLPQFKDQILPEAIGGGAGFILGSAVGAPNVGMSIGSGLGTFSQMYDVTRGSVYRTLLAEGVDEETALQAANDEALISSLIESGETALSWLMAGGGKAIGAISGAAKASVAKGSTSVATKFLANFATNSAAKKAVAEVSRPLWSKGLRLAGGVALQGGTEYLEEFTQGAVNRANRERALSGNADGKTQLIKGASGVIADAVTGKDPEALSDLHSQGMEGFKIGVMFGGTNATVNNIVSHYANAKTVKLQNEVADTILEDEESLNALIEEGKASGEGTVSEKIATEIETARENGKEVTREQVKQLIESNEVYIKAEEQAVDPLEQTAREVVAERNRTPITADEVKKTTGFGDSGAVLITKLMNDNGVSFESAKSAVETAYRVGLTGTDSRQVKFFNDTQRLAFEAGKSDKQVQDRAKQAKAQNAAVYNTGFTENEHSAKLTSAEREMFSTFANDFKMDVSMTDKVIAYYVNGKAREANARHVNGKMEVSSTSELPMVAVAMHEGFHRMRQLDPVGTDALMNFLYETSDQNVKRLKVGDTGVSNFERIKGEYSNVEGMEALDYIEEIACRRSETIFGSPEAYNEWRAKLEMNPQAKRAWQKLLDVIRELLEDMWATITNSKMSLEAKRQAQKELELFADAYRGAMKAADTRLQAVEAQKKTETQTETRSNVTESPVASENKVENKETPTKPKNKPQVKKKAVKVGETYTANRTGKTYTVTERTDTHTTYTVTDKNGKTTTRKTTNGAADINFNRAGDEGFTKVNGSTGIKVGDVFTAKKTGTTYKIVSRDDKNTKVEISSENGTKTMLVSNEVADSNFSNMSDDGITKWIDEDMHIDNRTWEDVGDRSVKAFQFLFPEMKDYYTPLAQELLGDLDNTIQGERMKIGSYELGNEEWIGMERFTSEAIATIKDNTNATYDDIRNALNRLINDEGQENIALAKRIELVFDEMLTKGYNTFDGTKIPPNEEYIAKKEALIGKTYEKYEPSEWDEDLPFFSLKKADEKAPTFYSHMGKTIDGIKQDKIGASSVVSYLKGRGVKDEEIKWSGIETFLEGKKSVTKAELQEFVAGSMLQIETKTIKDDITIRYTQEELADLDRFGKLLDKAWVEANDIWNEAYGTDIPADIMGSDNATNAMVRYVIDQHGGIGKFEGISHLSDAERKIYDDYGDNSITRKIKDLEEAQAYIAERAKARRDNTKQTKYHKYTLVGGSGNYRELLFKLPNSEYTNNAMSMHWGEGGILAHARVQDFDVNGQKMLFIEEIQSDWHNEGAKKGYADKGKAKQREKFEALREKNKAERKSLIEELSKHYEGKVAIPEESAEKLLSNIANDKSNFNALIKRDGISDTLAERIVNYELAKVEEALQLQESLKKGVEDAPFRNNYHEYVLKNLLRMAAEEGYDSIGWTTADIQSKRWSEDYAEGYRIEYDQDIPKFLNKYGKKWGAKVGTTVIGREEGHWEDKARWVEKEGTEVWSMPITDSMKNSVLYEGQPMFSLKKPVEETKNLIAVHNSTEEKLLGALKLGGLPSPSIAITKNDMSHDNFGDISLIFRKDSISPTDRRNKIYSGDAYTPTGVRVEYDVDDDVLQEFNKRLKELTPEWAKERLPSVDSGTAEAKNDSLYSAYERNDRAKFAFLREKGKAPKIAMRTPRLSTFVSNDTVIALAKAFSAKQLSDIANTSEGVKQYKNAFLKVIRDNEDSRAVATGIYSADEASLYDIAETATKAKQVKENKYKIKKEIDLRNTFALIDKKFTKALKEEYRAWIDENTKDAIIDKGIRNNRDLFTPSGKRRTFKQLHEPYNLSNIIKQMFSGEDKGIALFGGSPIGAAQHEYSSIADVKADSGRLQQLEQEEYDKMRDQIEADVFELARKMQIRSDVFAVRDLLSEAIGKKTKQQADLHLKRESQGWANYSPEFTNELWDIRERILNMPTAYFEAKPQRAVNFNEVALAVLPKGKTALRKQLEDAGVQKVVYYDKSKDGDRLKKINSVDTSFSLKNGVDVSPQKTTDYLNAVEGVQKGKKGAAERLAKYVDEGMIRTEAYDALIEKYGVIPSGERPHRDIQVPRKSGKKKNVSQTVRTILEAKATPDEAVPTIEKMVEDGIFSYDVYTDKEAIENGEDYIKEHGWEQSLIDWFEAVNSGEVSKDITTTGWILYNHAANIGDAKTSIMILDAMVRCQRSAAQALQATRILKKLSPESQLYGVQKSVEAFQKELINKYGDKAPELQINEELAEQFLTAETEEERLDAEIELYKDIGRQMPSDWLDMWNAWRYIAMLTNLRTHGRNILGNALFAPVVLTKDLIATGTETLVAAVARKKGKDMVRTKAFVGFGKEDRALLKSAWEDYKNVADIVSGGGKYNDSAIGNKYIQEGRRIFKGILTPVEWVRRGNSKLLELEDMWFSKPHYALALAQYCKANNITAEQLARGKALGSAREYAIKEAQKATYKDLNELSQMVSKWGRTGKNKNKLEKGVGVAVEGALPFRSTPANMLARGIEYSPIGFGLGIKRLSKVGKEIDGKVITATEAIDELSAGLTGAGLVALGVVLAANGIIRGLGKGDKDEKELEELMGHQNYALELENGESITLDWMAPASLPFFTGVRLWEKAQEENEGLTLADIQGAINGLSDPMLEMSFLQGLNDMFESIGYSQANETPAIYTILESAVTSYISQGIPTLFGQIERTGEEERMTTYVEKNSFFTNEAQRTLGKMSAKIPFWDYNQIPYIDAWGRKEASGTALKRGLNNFLNPAYTSTIETSDMEEELLQLYELTGDGGVFPSRADKYFTVDGERKDLTAEEYVRYATLKGEKSYELVSDLVESRAYQKLSATEQVKAIKEAYDYANQKAKQTISNYKPETWVYKADEFGSNVGNYISFKTEVSGKKEANGGKISKQEVVDIVLNMAQNDSETWKMYLSMYDSSNDLYAYNEGVNGEDYMYFLESLAEVDTPTKSGKYGTYTQDEAKEAVKQLEGLSRQEKAILWQSVNTGWKAKNNPWR